MALLDFFRKEKMPEGITKSIFECKRDDLIIRGTEYRPEGENLPIAIVCHGFMAWQDSVRDYTKFLAKLGYAAYCFDFNGGSVMKSQSEGKTTDMSVLTEVKDLEAVIEYLRTLTYVDKENIFLMGCSQGGFVSALVAAKNKYPVKKLSLFYPALCIPDDARAGKMQSAKFDPENVPEIIRCGPMKLGRQYAADVMHMNPFDEIKSYNGEVLIVHGTADRIVNVDYAKRAGEAYKSTTPEGIDVEKRVCLHIIEGGGHGFSKEHDAIAKEYLKGFAKCQDKNRHNESKVFIEER